MSALSIQVPFPVFQDRDGQPLDNGYIWIGVPNLNPQTNPVVAYYDEALTIVAPQPLRTLNGYISRAGTPAQVYVDAVNFSILVQDSKGSMVYNFPEGTGIEPNASGVIYDPSGTNTVSRTVASRLDDSVSIFNYIPESEHAAIQAGTSTYDCTAAIAQAIADCSAVTGGPYGYEKVIIFPEGWYSVQYIDVTARRNVWMWAEGYVIIKGINSTTKNFIFGSTNYNPSNPGLSTQTPKCFLGGPGQWEFAAAPGTGYQYGMRLEHFTGSHFENVSAGSGYVAITDTNDFTGSVAAAYIQYSYSNLFINCGFSCPAAPPVGNKSYGLAMGGNNVNSNTFIRCNWQGASATAAPYANTVGVYMNGNTNIWDNCDASALDTAFIGGGRGHQLRNMYSEYVTTFVSGPAAGSLDGLVVQGGLVEIVNSGRAFYPQNTQNLTIIGGTYKGALAGTKTFIDQTAGTLYGLNSIGPYLVFGDFANTTSGTYRNPDTLAYASVLQTKWLTFPQTQQGTTEPNTLDDYEEGTWTPAKAAGAAFVNASGNYTKIGNTVVATLLVEFPVEVDGSSASITGFPFSATGSTAERNGLALGYNSSSVNVGGTLSATTMTLRRVGAGGGSATYTQMSGSTLSGTMTYTI